MAAFFRYLTENAADLALYVAAGWCALYVPAAVERIATFSRRVTDRFRKTNSGDAVVQVPRTTIVHERGNGIVFDPPLEVPAGGSLTLSVKVSAAAGSAS